MYSGDAVESILTVSTIGNGKRNTIEYFLFFANPYMLARTTGIFLLHFVEEVIEGFIQLARSERPRINRFGFYPFIRAVATAVLRELSIFALIGDMIRSLPAMYATFVGYDEVAHHSGVARKDALRVLKGLDKLFEWLERLAEITSRPYHFVVLSDHGQSNGATFRQRTGKSLEEVVGELIGLKTFSPHSEDESWLRVNSLLTDISRQDSRSGRLVGKALKKRMKGGMVTLGPEANAEIKKAEDGAIVLASGNLGLIYFIAGKERMTWEDIEQKYPYLIAGLLEYPEIGFLLVRTAVQGPVVIGANGVYHLWDGRVEGKNPLAGYGEQALRQLIYEDGFSNCPDILVNSFYLQETDEVAAFEELVGSHGGLGGSQTKAILIYPANLHLGPEPIAGASSLHKAIKQWVPAE